MGQIVRNKYVTILIIKPTIQLSETCRVSFQNKFEKLMHLVGFIIRICHDVWSHERKKCKNSSHFTVSHLWTANIPTDGLKPFS
jgi:hypothetical protein